MVETARRILAKEMIDRQLAGQSSSTPCMSIKESYNNKKVTFDMQDGLEEKIDRLTEMLSKLTAKEDGTNKSSNLRYSKAKEEDRQEISMTNVITIRVFIKIDIDLVVEIKFHLVVEFSVDKLQGQTKV